jgi:hypothetical protein
LIFRAGRSRSKPGRDVTIENDRAFLHPADEFRALLARVGFESRDGMKRLGFLLLLLLAACGGSSNPGAAVEDYFRALVDKDMTKAVNLSCAAWEEGARTDVDTFAMYPATLENISCTDAGADGADRAVSCTGKAILDYNGEKQEIDLSARQYVVAREGGEWKMCGYK